MRRAWLLFFSLLLSLSASAAAAFPGDYDDEFRDAAMFLPVGTDWRLLKAQCYQESRLDPLAVSPVGAMGLCQFMPGTWSDMQRNHPELTSAWIPEQSIRAAAYYMGQLNRFWSAPRPAMDRYMLALASYNAGAGHLVKAQRLAGGVNYYAPIVEELPRVTGRHSEETINYVENIVGRWWPAMLFD
jgi:soluble lytic murein transglycosylase-like protein